VSCARAAMEIPSEEAAALLKLVEERRQKKARGSPRPSPKRASGESEDESARRRAGSSPAPPGSRHKRRRRPASLRRNKARSRTRQPILSPSAAASVPPFPQPVEPDASTAADAATEEQLSWTLASLRQLEHAAEIDQQQRNAAYVVERNKVRHWQSPVGLATLRVTTGLRARLWGGMFPGKGSVLGAARLVCLRLPPCSIPPPCPQTTTLSSSAPAVRKGDDAA